MLTIGTALSGGEGVGVGAQAAGVEHVWGIEWDDRIADVARENGFDVMTADFLAVEPEALQRVNIFHISTVCTRASNANQKGKESELDLGVARQTVRFLEVLQPRVFTLENVMGYRHFESFRVIVEALPRLGYFADWQFLNAANFGVPQTRKRLILRAVRGGLLPGLPAPVEWVGWYAAVEDLLPGLPDSEFAPWQLKRGVQALLDQTRLFSQGISRDKKGNEYDLLSLAADDPAFTVTGNSNMNGVRAFLVDGQNGGRDTELTVRGQREPSFTVGASVMDHGRPRAYVKPGRTVTLNVRCMARFQSFPDGYKLPDRVGLAGRVVGNAVPPLLYRRVVEGFL